jgi:hypothetical protein
MIKTRLAIAAPVALGLAGAPYAAEAKTHKHVRHHISATHSGAYRTSGTYGTSVSRVGTVTAPSVGSYYWPSVGTTNAVPTWNNTTSHTPAEATAGNSLLSPGIRR